MSDAQQNEVRANKKKGLFELFQLASQLDRKIVFQGPDNIRMDSRHAICEIGVDYVTFRLLGDDELVIPFAQIQSVRVQPTQMTVRYGGK